MTRRGAALLVALVAIVVVGSSLSIGHRLALDLHRRGKAALAAARAREAAASGLITVARGGAWAGALPGGSWWTVVGDTTMAGERILWSRGSVARPTPADLEAVALLSAPDSMLGVRTIRWWVVMRR